MSLLCSYTIEELAQELKALGEQPFVAGQIVEWVYGKAAPGWESMTNLSAQRRKDFAQRWVYPSLRFRSAEKDEATGDYHLLWDLSDRKQLETVYRPKERTATISSQAEGSAKRNVEPGEIVEQVLYLLSWAGQQGFSVEHLVFKAESLKNYTSVIAAVQVLSHKKMSNISQKRMSITSSGNIEGVKLLGQQQVKVDLVIGLHAPNQFIRNKILPNARKNPIGELLDAVELYANAVKRKAVYEYSLIPGLNDNPDHAFELANLLKRRNATVSIIPGKTADKKAVKDFRSVLFGLKVPNVIHSS